MRERIARFLLSFLPVRHYAPFYDRWYAFEHSQQERGKCDICQRERNADTR